LKPRFAKIARIAATMAAGLLAFVLLLVLVWTLINSFDTSLGEQAKALLTPPPNPYPTSENLYLAMAGLEGAGERPIVEMGQERIAAYNQALNAMRLESEVALELNKQWEAGKLKFNGNAEWGSSRTSSIWTISKSHRQEITALLTSNQRLYLRYLSLHHLHGYYETVRPSPMAPLVVVPQPLRTLFLADVANRIQSGTLQQQREALFDLQRDLQMWQTVLKGDGTLISKMLAAAYLHGDLILLADFITDPSSNVNSLDEALGPLSLPFDPKDFRIGNAFAAEFRVSASVYETITAPNEMAGSMASSNWWNRVGNALGAHFFKPNATENMAAAIAAQRIELGNSDPARFNLNLAAYVEWLDRNEPHLAPAFLYNPIGKILVKLAVPSNDGYYLRAYDVAAYQRLVYLAYQLKHQHIATADVPAFLNAHPNWSTHPVDGKPFRWNPETAELTVNTLGEDTRGRRFSVNLR